MVESKNEVGREYGVVITGIIDALWLLIQGQGRRCRERTDSIFLMGGMTIWSSDETVDYVTSLAHNSEASKLGFGGKRTTLSHTLIKLEP